ncbi:hypothetical protein Scep_007455 [Stephania cephalantha]|uniref:Uncharacterized protein n=1 Tax=Stephania cephalantha TaxID=152367 RepID=A0AAP0KBQ0_9MAGN
MEIETCGHDFHSIRARLRLRVCRNPPSSSAAEPYGSEVTRGQDLSGKDFSAETLIKQDFKTLMKVHGETLVHKLRDYYSI